jgi:hypothetical protein
MVRWRKKELKREKDPARNKGTMASLAFGSYSYISKSG